MIGIKLEDKTPTPSSRMSMATVLPEKTGISFVHLRVSNIHSMLEFYREALGFQRNSEDDSQVGLGSHLEGKSFLFLSEDKTALPALQRAPGLFHVAYLYPDRRELAKAFKRLYDHRWPFQGFADHGVSEALYLADPEGNGIELYADRPRSEWKYQEGQLQITTERLDIEDLLFELRDDAESKAVIDPLTRIGHLHLQVSDLSKAEQFYHKLVGFDVTQRNYAGALFVSAGGYHHRLGLNIWNSRGSTAPGDNRLGLARYGIEIGALAELKERLAQGGTTFEENERSIIATDQDGIQIEFT